MLGSFLNEITSKLPEVNRKDKEIYLKDKIDEKTLNDILIKVGLISIEIKNSEKSEIYYKFSLYGSNPDKSGLRDFVLGSHIKLDAEKSSICIYGYNENIISGMKKILFKEKILDEIYDKSEEYKKNPEKYEANTDDIIEKIEEKNTEPYNLFIIKHFIKFVMDKYKEENISSEDNSTNENIENTEDTKNISNNPFINDGE
ncbi:hypothetical protein [Brachyspira sp.]|uniref:hypothetical protein n=1 Tax=Brachyspira sp. TaxID=1977261 RepID=UPI003D7ECFEC